MHVMLTQSKAFTASVQRNLMSSTSSETPCWGILIQRQTPHGVYWGKMDTVLAEANVPISVQTQPVLILACHPLSFPKASLPAVACRSEGRPLDALILPHADFCWHKQHQGEVWLQEECSCMQVLGSCPACRLWHFPTPFSATVLLGDAGIWWLLGWEPSYYIGKATLLFLFEGSEICYIWKMNAIR